MCCVGSSAFAALLHALHGPATSALMFDSWAGGRWRAGGAAGSGSAGAAVLRAELPALLHRLPELLRALCAAALVHAPRRR